MKVLIVLFCLVMITLASPPVNIDHIDGEPRPRQPGVPHPDRVCIDTVGDIRAILGGQGKSITVSQNGEAIAVLYGGPIGDPNNTMEPYVAYSIDSGASWTRYGPFGTPPCRRMYNSVVGTPNFHMNPGELWFIWQENTQGYNDGELNVMIEENVPSSPSFSVPTILPNSQPPAMWPWEPDIDWDKDNPQNLVATGWSYLAYGNEWAYAWISHDGGYTWSDSIPMAYIPEEGSCGNLSFGNGGYVVYTYHDYRHLGGNDSIPAPYYMESTDGGYTWSAETVLDIVPANMGSIFFWYEMDCLVINNEPWFVHNDIGSPGGGPYVIKGSGSPGNWTWSMWDAGVIGSDSTYYGSTLWYCDPSQFPSLSHNPVTNMILCSYKSNVIIGSTWNGAHIQGIYTQDGGAIWYISDPLSSPNNGVIPWTFWHATETAHHLTPDYGNYSRTHSVWIDDFSLVMYYESELVTPWGGPGIEEVEGGIISLGTFHVKPSMVNSSCLVVFTIPTPRHTSLRVFDVAGRCVEDVFAGCLTEGVHKVNINTSRLSSGAYFVILETESAQHVEKIIVMR